jgi:hypothetical protein
LYFIAGFLRICGYFVGLPVNSIGAVEGETVRGSNVVDLVNDVLRKRKYFNPQGWETFGEASYEKNISGLGL